ncbi:uncharacterized protein LOC141581534 [Saimiri boliviensis]|uniref:uncharacterized protein LOC141581534 n=1 Tax=Saimiri boliviensis TaxID=27679 RepID=UPI003D770FB0
MYFLNDALCATASNARLAFLNYSLEDGKSLSHPLQPGEGSKRRQDLHHGGRNQQLLTAGGRQPPGRLQAAGTGLRLSLPEQPHSRAHSSGESCGTAPAASRGAALPHTRPTPAPEAAARSRREGAQRGGQGKVTHWESAAARAAHGLPAPLPGTSSRSPQPAEEAENQPGSAPPPQPPRISWQETNSGRDFTSQPPLLPSRGPAPRPSGPTRTRANRRQHRAGGGGPEGGLAYPRAREAGQKRDRHSRVRVRPLRPRCPPPPPAPGCPLRPPDSPAEAPLARCLRAPSAAARNGTAGEGANIQENRGEGWGRRTGGAGKQKQRCAGPQNSWTRAGSGPAAGGDKGSIREEAHLRERGEGRDAGSRAESEPGRCKVAEAGAGHLGTKLRM